MLKNIHYLKIKSDFLFKDLVIVHRSASPEPFFILTPSSFYLSVQLYSKLKSSLFYKNRPLLSPSLQYFICNELCIARRELFTYNVKFVTLILSYIGLFNIFIILHIIIAAINCICFDIRTIIKTFHSY